MLPISLKNNLTAGLSIKNEADQKILIITKPHLGLNLKKTMDRKRKTRETETDSDMQA